MANSNQSKKKLLFIPADNISLRISRSYYLAKGLSDHFDLYFVDWNDVMDAIWAGERGSALNSLKSFVSSIFRPLKIEFDEQDGFHRISAPVAQTAFIRKLVGDYYAYKFMHWLNRKTVRRFVAKLEPDLIFAADGFFMFPWVPSQARVISDIQDDFDEERPRIKEYSINYFRENYSHAYLRYAVSQPTAVRLTKLYENPFKALANGADFSTIRSIPERTVDALRAELGLAGKTIISFIGTAAKYDGEFLRELSRRSQEELPQVHFVIVGNVQAEALENVTFVGTKSVDEAALFYRLSDIGIVLNDTRQSKFLYHSVPLKIIQYSAARKPLITYPVAWAEDLPISNIAIVNERDASAWLEVIKNMENYEWTNTEETFWKQFSWDIICAEVAKEITEGM